MTGKVALLTGAGRGIGLAMAKALARAGCAVAILDIDLAVAQTEAKAIIDAGGKAIAIAGDINDLSLPARAVTQTMDRLGALHVLINNASIQHENHWLEISAQDIETDFRANVTSPILFCQQVTPIFIRQRFGRIVNIGSVQQLSANPHMLPYSVSKSALVGLTKGLARELTQHQITVNLIAPGWINTYRNRDDFPTEKDLIEKGRHVPIGRIGAPKDFGGAALLLCSNAGSYITGQVIYIDGGMTT